MLDIKRIIAKEGLILLGLAGLLYFIIPPLYRNIPVVFPSYKVQFTNNDAYTVVIYPDMNYEDISNSKLFLKQIHNPPQKLISKRIDELSKKVKAVSPLKYARCVNQWQVRLSEFFSLILAQSLLIKILFAYCFLAIIRFIFWSVKTLKHKGAR